MNTIASILPSFIDYLKNPVNNIEAKEFEWKDLVRITLLHYLVFVVAIAIFGILASLISLDQVDHKLEDLFGKMNAFLIFLIVVILAPIIEELIFRGPLRLGFKSEKSRPLFKYWFYFIAILFAVIHVTNFGAGFKWYFIPIMVLPQFSLALVLGYTRMHYGMWSNIYLHMLNNFFPIITILLFPDLT